MISIPTLSFCITCKNRIHQIKQTLRKNLNDNYLHREFVEFILVDFGSTDGLREWILSEFIEELNSGYLRYYYTDELTHWHASIAKNTAHICARNDILVNLDCDNYTGYLGGKFIINCFYVNRMDIVCHQFGGDLYDGSYGRISTLRKHFHQIGGYDENLEPMSFQDRDLLNRLRAIGISYVLKTDRTYNQAIRNTKDEGLSNTNSSKKFKEMFEINKGKSENGLAEGHLVVNNGYYGIRGNLIDHRGNSFIPINT